MLFNPYRSNVCFNFIFIERELILKLRPTDYYDRTTPIVDDIAVPTFVLNSADDPFFNRDVFPSELDCSDKNDGVPIKIVRTEYGGHLGHLFHFVDEDGDAAKPVASFAPMQLAKFLDHIHNNSN